MKTLKLKKLRDKTPGQPEMDFDYKDVLMQIVTGGAPNGISLNDMSKRMRIANRLEPADGVVELEDADYNLLMKIVADHTWPRVFVSAIALETDLKAAGKEEAAGG